MALVGAAMMAQQPVITFEKTEHDFGKINEADGRVSVVFEFKNEGMAPLVLSNVRASCGCTTPTWTKEPVEPGQSGSITVTYNPNGRPGRFQKTVTVTSNATEGTKKVYIKGEVIPKSAKPANKYTISVGELNMKSKTLDMGTIKKGENKSGELEYANLTQTEHKVSLESNPLNASFLITQVTLPSPKANETGKFVFVVDTKESNVYGPVEAAAYVVVDGKNVQDEAHKLTIKANIVEDFSALSVEDKQQAPIIEVPASAELGKAAAGKTLKGKIEVKNIGVNPLEIRRVYSTEENLSFKALKPVKSGKKGMLAVEVNTKGMKPGTYSREVVVISNDYANSIKKIKVNFTVE
jgi:hypothetical protein